MRHQPRMTRRRPSGSGAARQPCPRSRRQRPRQAVGQRTGAAVQASSGRRGRLRNSRRSSSSRRSSHWRRGRLQPCPSSRSSRLWWCGGGRSSLWRPWDRSHRRWPALRVPAAGWVGGRRCGGGRCVAPPAAGRLSPAVCLLHSPLGLLHRALVLPSPAVTACPSTSREPSPAPAAPLPTHRKQSIHNSVLGSPSPPTRVRPTGSISARPSVMPELRAAGGLAAAMQAAAAAAAVEQGVVDQPAPQQQQQQAAEPAAAAAAVEPEAAAAEAVGQQQQGAAGPAGVAVERTGSSPLQEGAAKRQRTSPRRSPKLSPSASGAALLLAALSNANVAVQPARLCTPAPLHPSPMLRSQAAPSSFRAHVLPAGRPGGSVRFDLAAGAGAGPAAPGAAGGGSPGASTGEGGDLHECKPTSCWPVAWWRPAQPRLLPDPLTGAPATCLLPPAAAQRGAAAATPAPAPAAAAAAAGGAEAGAEVDAWWDPLDPEKVRRGREGKGDVRQGRHGGGCRGSQGLHRAEQLWWRYKLQFHPRQLAVGGRYLI